MSSVEPIPRMLFILVKYMYNQNHQTQLICVCVCLLGTNGTGILLYCIEYLLF